MFYLQECLHRHIWGKLIPLSYHKATCASKHSNRGRSYWSGSDICLKAQPEVNSVKKLNDKISVELLWHHTEPQRSKRAPIELKSLCKSFNTEDAYVSYFIEPPKGREAIKSVLIIFGDILSDLTFSFFYIYLCSRWVSGWLLAVVWSQVVILKLFEINT